jgi:hypothetical protein
VLGQGKSHRMALLVKTKTDDYPNGLAWEFINKAKKANKPSDASAMIEMDIELDQVQLKGARDFYNNVVRVLDKYEVKKSDPKLCMLMARKNQEASYVKLILDELKLNSPDFDRLCNDVSEIQRLTRSGNKGCMHDKEVNLSSVEGEGKFHGKCYNCGKVCRYQTKECKKQKGDWQDGHTGDSSKGGNTSSGVSGKTCNFCGVTGHKESQCYKKNAKKAPSWWKGKLDKVESVSLSIQISLASMGKCDGSSSREGQYTVNIAQ